MNHKGIAVAIASGLASPEFPNAPTARRALFALRDQGLRHLKNLSRGEIDLDFTPDSLVPLEHWYFALRSRRGFGGPGNDVRRFETAMGLYLAAVAVRHVEGARWRVKETPFTPGHYELAVEAGNTTVAGVDVMCHAWHRKPNNKTQRALYRRYHDYFVPSKPPRLPTVRASDGEIGIEIQRLLSRKSSHLIHPTDLAMFVEHHLRGERTVEPVRVGRVASALERRRVLKRVPLQRGAGFRWSLA